MLIAANLFPASMFLWKKGKLSRQAKPLNIPLKLLSVHPSLYFLYPHFLVQGHMETWFKYAHDEGGNAYV